MALRRTKDAKIALLQDVALFAGCNRKELGKVASLVDEIELSAGDVIARQGETGHEFFVIADGEVAVAMPDGGAIPLAAGSFFGEMALLDGGPRVATVTAVTDVHLLVVDRRAFTRLLREMPSVSEKVLVELARRLRAVETASPTS